MYEETSLSGDELIRLRQNELTLIAQHKYGVRVSTDCKWKEFIAHLGESAVTFELLQTKPSSAVKINFDASSGSSKGAAFVLYNCARLETIIRTYNERVNDGTYPPLPDFEETDFSLLIQEEEWCLIFNYILGLPLLLKSCVEVNEHTFEFRPHLLCGFLSSMVKLISQYYRKTRVLTEPRKHLLPVMFARLHMLNILNETLKTSNVAINRSRASGTRITQCKGARRHQEHRSSRVSRRTSEVRYSTRSALSYGKKCFVWKQSVHVSEAAAAIGRPRRARAAPTNGEAAEARRRCTAPLRHIPPLRRRR
ncbi:unnamed protein product, partial [Iphiclides podalirius]